MKSSFFEFPSFHYRSCQGHLPPSPSSWSFRVFSSPWSRVISFLVRIYYSGLSFQTVYTVLLSQYSLHEPVLWTSSLQSPGYCSIASDWLRVPNVYNFCTTKSKTLLGLLVFRSMGKKHDPSHTGSRVALWGDHGACLTTAECPGFRLHPREMPGFLSLLLFLL